MSIEGTQISAIELLSIGIGPSDWRLSKSRAHERFCVLLGLIRWWGRRKFTREVCIRWNTCYSLAFLWRTVIIHIFSSFSMLIGLLMKPVPCLWYDWCHCSPCRFSFSQSSEISSPLCLVNHVVLVPAKPLYSNLLSTLILSSDHTMIT